MAYTTQYGLPQNVVNYLNQQLPTADIYGGITSVPFTFDDVAAEQQIEAQASGTLTPEQLRLLYLQQQRGGGEGREDDTIDTTNNAGINSLSDLTNYVSTPGIIGGVLAGIPGAIIGRGLGKLYDNYQNQYTDIFGRVNQATQAAIARENLKDLQDRMDRGEVDFSGGISAAQDAARGGYAGGRGGDHDGGASAGAQSDAAAGMGGY